MIERAMPLGLETFVGRTTELELLCAGVIDATRGNGTGWLVTGEPGIGKTRLVEELARTLHGQVAIAWGRCWEEGGAPPYWPWTQALRALVRKREIDAQSCLTASRAPWLIQLVPEFADRLDCAPPRVEPDVSRFRLHDAVVGALSDIAERVPLLLIFEDLHAADTSSVELVEFLAKQIRSTRIALIGTLREAEARRGPCQSVLERIERDARCLTLHRLDQEAVECYLERVLGRSPSTSLAEAMMQASEGNPLFLSEIVRRQSALARIEREGVLPTVPPSIQAAIADRIAELTPTTRALLETAAAFGREVHGDLLLCLSGNDRSTMFASLAEAIDHAVLFEAAPDLFRFSHILVRETIHERTEIERRRDLHRRVARALEGRTEVAWSTVAQHYLLGGQPARGAALTALRRAAEQAERALAFAEASGYYQQALELDPDERARCELSLGLASTLRHRGKVGEARRASEAALEVARRLDDRELFAVAALEHGGVLEIGATSDALIDLLEQALDRLEPGDSAIRARVMARLAAARQPCAPPEIPFELARRAISMARRVSREHDLLETLRVAISALMDLADPRERIALNREHIALAERLDAPLDLLLSHGRLALDAAELGEPGALAAALANCAWLVEHHDLAHHRWRVSLLEAMCATKDGRFEEAEALSLRASSEAERASEPWALRSIQMQRHLRARLRGDFRRAIEILDELEPLLQGFEFGRHIATLLRAATLAGAGRQTLAASLFDEELVRWPLSIGDLSLLELAAEAALAKDDHPVMERLLARIRPEAHRFISWGILGAAIGPPASAIVGRLLAALGKEREGEQHLREAWAKAQATSCAPQAAWIALWIARLPGARSRRECAEEALRAAEALSMPGLAEQAQALLHELSSAPKTAAGSSRSAVSSVEFFSMRCEGGLWIIECGDRIFHMRDRRGLRLLSRLVESPRRAFHVLDLESSLGANPADGGSDAGEMIDARARDAYRKRVEALRDELAEAERWSDT